MFGPCQPRQWDDGSLADAIEWDVYGEESLNAVGLEWRPWVKQATEECRNNAYIIEPDDAEELVTLHERLGQLQGERQSLTAFVDTTVAVRRLTQPPQTETLHKSPIMDQNTNPGLRYFRGSTSSPSVSVTPSTTKQGTWWLTMVENAAA